MNKIQKYFTQKGRVIRCCHDNKKKMNIENVVFNLGDVCFLPCERCLVALKEGIFGLMVEKEINKILKKQILKRKL